MTTKEKVEVMQAYEDGKQIQTRTNLFKNNLFKSDWADVSIEPSWDWVLNDYRIKPEVKKPTCRPYKDTCEMIADFEERFGVKIPPYAKPMVWVKSIKENYITNYVSGYGKYNVLIYDVWIDLDLLFNRYTYLDGSPIGKLVEE